MSPEEIERAEALISVIDQCQTQDKRWAIVVGFMQAERGEESEACARICDDIANQPVPSFEKPGGQVCAAAIRARMADKE